MIKVLHIIDRLKKVSGIATSILNYYYHLDYSLVQFDFLTVEYDYDIVENIRKRGGRVFKVEKLGLTNVKKVKEQITVVFENNSNYDIVHSSFYHIDFLLFPIAKKYGINVCISHSHNTRYADYFVRSIRNALLSKIGARYATHFMACSKLAAEFQFGKKSIIKNNVFILKNAIESNKYLYNETTRIRERKALGLTDKYVIGNVGRFNKQKNHGFLIELFSKYSRLDDNAVLLLIGVGELMEQYKELAKKLELDEKVIFLGARDDVPNLLQAMDCFVFPSIYEGLGIALIEAQASGLPCIASSVIPIESKVSKNITYLNINSENNWIASIHKYKGFNRKNLYDDIVKSGYDIASAAKELENYYLSLIKGE